MQIYRQNSNLKLRSFLVGDYPYLTSLRADHDTQFNLITVQSLSKWDDEARSWANSMVAGDYQGLRGAFSTFHTTLPNFIGYWQLVPKNELTFVGLAILPSVRGKGYGKSGFNLVNEYAFDLGLSPLYLEVLESNLSAIHLYLEYGYSVVSSAKQSVYGRICNVLTMRSK